jgi:ABC-2 type transport system permease protein
VIALETRPPPVGRAFGILVRWRVAQMRQELAQLVLVQILFATGTAVGLGFLISDVDPVAGAYLATGGFLLNLLLVSIAMVPGTMTEAKVSGALDYMWSLPFPRLVYLLADLTLWSLCVLPGMLISLVVTSIRFDFDLHVTPLVVPAVALVLVTGATVGAAIGLRSPSQQATNMFSNFVIIIVLLFSPVNFPAERLPGWLQAVHEALPIAHMADLMRATLVSGIETHMAVDFVVLGLWCAVALAMTVRGISRRA